MENDTLINSRISFKAMTSSLEFDLQRNIPVSSANKISFDISFIVCGKSLIYIPKREQNPEGRPV
jgi:hypothetical protein